MKLRPVIMAVPVVAAPRSFRQVQMQRASARRALTECARRCGAPAEGWDKNDAGVPQPNSGFHWSISHKRKWSAAVIADRRVGIDIEHIVPRRHRLHDAAAGSREWSILGDDSWTAFYRMWTAKEATLKANGVGLAALGDCRLVDVIDDDRMTLKYDGRSWCVEHYRHADHIVAVTCGESIPEWCVLDEPACAAEDNAIPRRLSACG